MAAGHHLCHRKIRVLPVHSQPLPVCRAMGGRGCRERQGKAGKNVFAERVHAGKDWEGKVLQALSGRAICRNCQREKRHGTKPAIWHKHFGGKAYGKYIKYNQPGN